MNPRASSLFHFTKSKEVLFEIFRHGFWPRYCLEDIEWHGNKDYDFVAFPMVCFCDIPLTRISEHVNFYGSFGIGLTKDWGKKNDLNPIMYFTGSNPILKSIKSLTAQVQGSDQSEVGLKNVRHILAHSKPISGRMIIAGEPVIKEFYQETEWRFVPINENVNDHLSKEKFEDTKSLSEHNEITAEHCRLKFVPSDVRHIFVPNDSDIPEIVNFIQTELDSYPSADLKVLITRIVSLESISQDL